LLLVQKLSTVNVKVSSALNEVKGLKEAVFVKYCHCIKHLLRFRFELADALDGLLDCVRLCYIPVDGNNDVVLDRRQPTQPSLQEVDNELHDDHEATGKKIQCLKR